MVRADAVIFIIYLFRFGLISFAEINLKKNPTGKLLKLLSVLESAFGAVGARTSLEIETTNL